MIDTSVVRVHQHGACIADNNSISLSRRVRRMTIGWTRGTVEMRSGCQVVARHNRKHSLGYAGRLIAYDC
jgi:hypothetical protein